MRVPACGTRFALVLVYDPQSHLLKKWKEKAVEGGSRFNKIVIPIWKIRAFWTTRKTGCNTNPFTHCHQSSIMVLRKSHSGNLSATTPIGLWITLCILFFLQSTVYFQSCPRYHQSQTTAYNEAIVLWAYAKPNNSSYLDSACVKTFLPVHDHQVWCNGPIN